MVTKEKKVQKMYLPFWYIHYILSLEMQIQCSKIPYLRLVHISWLSSFTLTQSFCRTSICTSYILRCKHLQWLNAWSTSQHLLFLPSRHPCCFTDPLLVSVESSTGRFMVPDGSSQARENHFFKDYRQQGENHQWKCGQSCAWAMRNT